MIGPDRTERTSLNNNLSLKGSRVFVEHWRSASEPPEETGNYLIAIHFYEPIVALFIKGSGWYLEETEHIGLEESVKFWMPLPEPPRKAI